MRHLAQIRLAPEGGFKGFGPLGLEDRSASDAPLIFNTFIRAVIGLLTIVAFIWFLFLLIFGAIGVLTSGGDKAKVSYIVTKYHERLDRLSSMGLLPGVQVKLHQRQPTYVIQMGETQIAIDDNIARDIYVRLV